MKRNYDLAVDKVEAYTEFVGSPSPQPLAAVIRYDDLPPIRHARVRWGVYALFLLDDTEEELSYGQRAYAYEAGSLVCVAPGQIGGAKDDGTTFRRRGWAVLFDPALFRGSDFARTLPRQEFFRYGVNRGLSLTKSDRLALESVLNLLASELTGPGRSSVASAAIRLILAYAEEAFRRQNPLGTVPEKNEGTVPKNQGTVPFERRTKSPLIDRLMSFLTDFLLSEAPQLEGVPSVTFCARRLGVAPNYLSDVVRAETGERAHTFIARHVIARAKDLLAAGKSVSETAYALGFDYPSHFTRFFKREEGRTPSRRS